MELISRSIIKLGKSKSGYSIVLSTLLSVKLKLKLRSSKEFELEHSSKFLAYGATGEIDKGLDENSTKICAFLFVNLSSFALHCNNDIKVFGVRYNRFA